MYVRSQTSQAFVTRSGPFGDCSCKFVYWPCNVWFTNACQTQAFEDNLRAYFWQFSDRSQFILFALMVIQAWSCNFVQLLVCFVRQLAISFHTFSLHDLPHHRTIRRCLRQVSLNEVAFLLLFQRSCIQTYFCYCPQYLCSSRILLECNPNIRGQGRMLVRPNLLLR